MREIQLTQGRITFVDDDDFEDLNKNTWGVTKGAVDRVIWDSGNRRHEVMSRRIMKCPPDRVVDHIDGNPLNNQRSNLRICIPSENQRNRRMPSINTSGFKGVTWHKQCQKWQSQIGHYNKNYHLGLFDTKEEAYEAYKRKSKELHGEYAKIE